MYDGNQLTKSLTKIVNKYTTWLPKLNIYHLMNMKYKCLTISNIYQHILNHIRVEIDVKFTTT